jgi:riboflavin kinase
MGIVVEGIVETGLGEGAFFMSMPHYKKEIREKTGFDAYPGTLNIKVTPESVAKAKSSNFSRIERFTQDSRQFAGVNCHSAKINNIKGAVIFPDFTRHKNVLEFIAPIHLRTELKLKDKDLIKVELE